MGKQLKKTEMTQEQENNFRAALSYAASTHIAKKDKFVPSIHLIPEQLLPKIINNPEKFTSRLKSTDDQKIMVEFIKFVFNKYRVPKFMEKVWLPKPAAQQPGRWVVSPRHETLNDLMKDPAKIRSRNNLILTQYGYKFVDWYVCIATGGSLYKEHCKDFMTKKEVHNFLTCPHDDLDLKQIVVFAIAKAYGASVGISLRIARSKISDRNLSAASGKFWREVIQFFSMNPPDSVQDVDDLCDYFLHKHNEDNTYTILGQGFTVKSLQKKMKDWHYELRRMKIMGNAEWEGHPINDYQLTTKDDFGNEVYWEMVQIKSAVELSAEGTAQHHCVYSYKQGCVNGTTSIWSLRSVDKKGTRKRRVTVELNNNGYIPQIRGFANRTAKRDEMHVVQQWAKHNNLYMRY